MRRQIRLLVAAATTLAGAFPVAISAQTTENHVGAVATATLAYSNNPFSEQGGSGRAISSPLVILDLTPTFQHLTQRSVLTISGDVNLQQYFRGGYGSNPSYSVAADYRLRAAERITGHARVDLSSAVLGSFNSFAPPLATVPATGTIGVTTPGAATTPGGTLPLDPTLLVPTSPLLTDVGLYGLRSRRRSGRVSGDMSIGVTERDNLTVSAYAEATRYGGGATGGFLLGNYEAYSATLGYQRRVSAYINLGVQGTASMFDYHDAGTSHVYAVEATATGRLSPILTLNGAFGVSFVDGGGLGSTRRTSPSGSINLCRQGQRSTMCAQASREVSPTGLSGSQYATVAGVNWSRRLSEHDGLSASASYSSIGGDRLVLTPNAVPLQTKYAQATLGYDRQLRQRLRLVASANVRQLLGSSFGGSRPVDYGGQIGLSYQFGDVR